MLIRLYDDGNGNFIWPKTESVDKGERTTDGQVIRRSVPVVPERFQTVVYTLWERDDKHGMRGYVIEGSAKFPAPSAKVIGQAILEAVARLEAGKGVEIEEGGWLGDLEVIEC